MTTAFYRCIIGTSQKNTAVDSATYERKTIMKKIISLVLALACCLGCVFALASCGAKGSKVALQSGTTSEMYANVLKGIEIASFDTFALAATDMKNGNSDYVFCDKTTAASLVREIDGLKIIDEIPLAKEYYGIAIDKNQADLKDKINAALVKNAVEIAAIEAKYLAGTEALYNGVTSAKKDTSKADKQLVVATNAEFAPFEYVEGDKYYGIDMEIAKIIADELGMELVIEDMAFNAVVGAVGNNGVDIAMSGITITAEREQAVNFSTPYYVEDIVVICTEDDTSLDNAKTVVDILTTICTPAE